MRVRNIQGARRGEGSEFASRLGERKGMDDLFSVAYEELRRLASAVRRGDPCATLNPTALVNEAWLKLANSPDLAGTSPLHFKRIAARAMRQLLIEAARRRNSHKRGDGVAIMVELHDLGGEPMSSREMSCGEEMLALDIALDELAAAHPRQAIIVESRFFGGLDVTETATLLEVSEATIMRDWRAARAWLAHELRSRP